MGHDFALRDLVGKDTDQWMAHAVRDEFNRQDFTGIGDELMSAVQYADLHYFETLHIIREGRAGLVQIGPACVKIVLDHPLAEIFTSHRRGVFDLKRSCQLQFLGPRGRHDAVNH